MTSATGCSLASAGSGTRGWGSSSRAVPPAGRASGRALGARDKKVDLLSGGAGILDEAVPPEQTLIQALRAGSREAFIELVRQHQRVVRAYLWSYLAARGPVDDLAQETFLAAYRDVKRFRGESSLSTWLLGIARHRALEYLRAQGRREARGSQLQEQGLLERTIALLEVPESDPARRERELEVLEGCVAKLAPHSASLIAEHYFGGRPLVDLARGSGQKESAVRVQILRIRRWLRQCMEASLGKGSPP